MGKEESRQQMILGQLNIYMQENDLNAYRILYTKPMSKWINDIRAKTIKS